jgi:hypothetical protein
MGLVRTVFIVGFAAIIFVLIMGFAKNAKAASYQEPIQSIGTATSSTPIYFRADGINGTLTVVQDGTKVTLTFGFRGRTSAAGTLRTYLYIQYRSGGSWLNYRPRLTFSRNFRRQAVNAQIPPGVVSLQKGRRYRIRVSAAYSVKGRHSYSSGTKTLLLRPV